MMPSTLMVMSIIGFGGSKLLMCPLAPLRVRFAPQNRPVCGAICTSIILSLNRVCLGDDAVELILDSEETGRLTWIT